MMDYVYVVVHNAEDIVELIVAYQYEKDALAYIAHERAIDPRLAQYLEVEKIILRL